LYFRVDGISASDVSCVDSRYFQRCQLLLDSDSIIFFFQAEDGIRDFHVTGVQTCALPIAADDIAQADIALRYSRGCPNNWALPCARLKNNCASCSQVIAIPPCSCTASDATCWKASEQ